MITQAIAKIINVGVKLTWKTAVDGSIGQVCADKGEGRGAEGDTGDECPLHSQHILLQASFTPPVPHPPRHDTHVC